MQRFRFSKAAIRTKPGSYEFEPYRLLTPLNDRARHSLVRLTRPPKSFSAQPTKGNQPARGKGGRKRRREKLFEGNADRKDTRKGHKRSVSVQALYLLKSQASNVLLPFSTVSMDIQSSRIAEQTFLTSCGNWRDSRVSLFPRRHSTIFPRCRLHPTEFMEQSSYDLRRIRDAIHLAAASKIQ